MLVGCEGLRSNVRTVLNPSSEMAPVWSGYTCFAAIAYTVPSDIKEVGYKVRSHTLCTHCVVTPHGCEPPWNHRVTTVKQVWLGRRKYFVSVDVGGGRIQWCAEITSRQGHAEVTPRSRFAWGLGEVDGWTAGTFLDRYAFLNIPPGGLAEGQRKGEGALDFVRLSFEGWSADGGHCAFTTHRILGEV